MTNKRGLLILLGLVLGIALCRASLGAQNFPKFIAIASTALMLWIIGQFLVFRRLLMLNKWTAVIIGSVYLGLSFTVTALVMAHYDPNIDAITAAKVAIAVWVLVTVLALAFGLMGIYLGARGSHSVKTNGNSD